MCILQVKNNVVVISIFHLYEQKKKKLAGKKLCGRWIFKSTATVAGGQKLTSGPDRILL